MSNLSKLDILRCVISIEITTLYEIHGFCDASEQAYGACVYIRTINSPKDGSCNLSCTKSKVAPLKASTLPRLELWGALLLAALIDRLRETLPINNFTFLILSYPLIGDIRLRDHHWQQRDKEYLNRIQPRTRWKTNGPTKWSPGVWCFATKITFHLGNG
ncbi:hypothetical protein Trydic_g22012 [Trypoxylus dichotomus]